MTFKLPDGTVPERLQLSETQSRSLTDMADQVVAETLHASERFVADGRQVDSRLWKHVKSREKVHVYRTRRSASKRFSDNSRVNEKEPSRPRLLSCNTVEQQQREAIAAGRPHTFAEDDDDELEDNGVEKSANSHSQHTQSSSSADGSFSVFPEESVLEKVKPVNVPLIAATGIIDGSVEDVAFGALAHTKHTWLVRNSYVKNDGFDGRKVIATMQSPSEEDPFRFVGIKWATRDIGAFMTRRDCLFLESSGIAFDADGERVYYSLAQSIELADCPPLTGRFDIIRLNLSICYIIRQLDDNRIEVYARGYADMGGNLPESIGVSVFSQGVANAVGIVECSYLRKLSWLMARRRPSYATEQLSKDCGVCGNRLNKLVNLLQPGSSCALCRQATCGKCSVQKKLTVDAEEEVTQRTFTFCISCVIKGRKLSAWDVATAQLKSQ
ncbi:hypothetical protein BBJ28_00006571 [Nothophytophthora sp. Chile5]|nr:hypothetical protein BBJ28_00006571 [Nothophytophthora sp. Chile5]